MTTRKDDMGTVREWLYLETDGELTPAQVAEVEALAATSEAAATDRRQLVRLDALLRDSRIEVDDGFRDGVLEALPPAGWSARHPSSWWFAAVALLLLGGSAALLTGLGAARLDPELPFASAIAAVLDLGASALAAGAGLLGASWKGIGMAVGAWLGGSVPNVVAFVIVVAGLQWLFWGSLWRRLREPQSTAGERRDRRHRLR